MLADTHYTHSHSYSLTHTRANAHPSQNILRFWCFVDAITKRSAREKFSFFGANSNGKKTRRANEGGNTESIVCFRFHILCGLCDSLAHIWDVLSKRTSRSIQTRLYLPCRRELLFYQRNHELCVGVSNIGPATRFNTIPKSAIPAIPSINEILFFKQPNDGILYNLTMQMVLSWHCRWPNTIEIRIENHFTFIYANANRQI